MKYTHFYIYIIYIFSNINDRTYLIQALRKAASLCYPKVCQVILSHVKMESVPFDVVDEIIDDFDINDEDDRRCAETYKILLQYLGENCQCGETMPVR